MANLFSGVIALVIALGYVGILAVRVNSVALWVVILAVVAMMLWSFYESVRESDETG